MDDDHTSLLRLADVPEPFNFIQIDEIVQIIRRLSEPEKRTASAKIEQNAQNPENQALLLSLLELFSEADSLTYTERLFSVTDPEYASACLSWAKIPQGKAQRVQNLIKKVKKDRRPLYLTIASVLVLITLIMYFIL